MWLGKYWWFDIVRCHSYKQWWIPLCLALGTWFFMPPRWGRHYPFHTRSDAPIIGKFSPIFICMKWGAGSSPNHLWRTQGHTNDRWRLWDPKKTTGIHTTGDHRRQPSPHRSHGLTKNKCRPSEYFVPLPHGFLRRHRYILSAPRGFRQRPKVFCAVTAFCTMASKLATRSILRSCRKVFYVVNARFSASVLRSLRKIFWATATSYVPMPRGIPRCCLFDFVWFCWTMCESICFIVWVFLILCKSVWVCMILWVCVSVYHFV